MEEIISNSPLCLLYTVQIYEHGDWSVKFNSPDKDTTIAFYNSLLENESSSTIRLVENKEEKKQKITKPFRKWKEITDTVLFCNDEEAFPIGVISLFETRA